MNWKIWERVESLLFKFQIKPIIAVVPDNQDPGLIIDPPRDDFWDLIRYYQSLGWSIGLHGNHHRWNVQWIGLVINRCSEFAGLPCDLQLKYLESAVKIFASHGIVPDLWIAPKNSFDETTVHLLSKVGIKVISYGYYFRPVKRLGVIWIPQQMFRFSNRPFGLWTICYHHNEFTELDIARFATDIERYRNRIMGLREALEKYIPIDEIWVDRLFSWCYINSDRFKRHLFRSVKNKLKNCGNSSLRIAIFLPFLRQGGVERIMLNLAQGIVDRGIEVDFVLASRFEGPYNDQVRVKVRRVELGASTPYLALPRLIRYLKIRRPHIIFAALTPANILAILAKYLSRVETKVIISVHIAIDISITTTPLKAMVRPFAYRTFYQWADGIVAVSKGIAQALITLGLPNSKIHIIYNPIVTPDLYEKAKEDVTNPWFAPRQPPVVLGAGRLCKQKGFCALIRAFALVRKERQARLVILGEGEERPKLEKLIRELGLEEDVALLGFVENPYAYMKRASIFVLSSAYEGFGNVVAEALAVGTPVVSTDCPHGPAEILEEGKWGILVPVGDVQALAQAIIEALDKSWDRDALRRRAQAFSLDTIVSQYLKMMGIDT